MVKATLLCLILAASVSALAGNSKEKSETLPDAWHKATMPRSSCSRRLTAAPGK